MKQALLTLILALLCSLASFSQVDLRLGPGIGYGVFAPPATDAFAHSYSSYETHYNVGQSAIAGMNCRWRFGKHWVLQHGLDYQFSQRHSYGSYYSSTYLLYAQGYKYDRHWRAQQILMPISGGFSFGKGKVRHSLLVGLRLGYLVSNVEIGHTEYTTWTYPSPSPGTLDSKENLLQNVVATRWSGQLQISYQVEIGNGLFMSLNFAKGKPISNLPYTNSHFSLPNSMVYFMVGYRPFGHVFKRQTGS